MRPVATLSAAEQRQLKQKVGVQRTYWCVPLSLCTSAACVWDHQLSTAAAESQSVSLFEPETTPSKP